jgi:hypothetical protein
VAQQFNRSLNFLSSRLQVHKATQEKQIEQWRQLICDWSRATGETAISVNDCPLFENKKINSTLH